ncbi:dTDP-4-dehydrorhamnose reductase [Methylocapsa aurea]|uniref:dTDP-4-dehydrorhamnose reductase n=1 Tax=Methylocapsa aurea TaxID=663610 RepID=UPI000562B765|nr:dTDP-4-dehydrorhamnose reductase [Methylocapsa aurea]
MRILVTGRDGQVARALRNRAGERLEVVAIGRPEFDLGAQSDPTALFKELGPDVIVNAAAYTAVDKAEADRDAALAVNGFGAGAAARAAARLDAPIIQLSTDYVFDGAATRAYREDDPTAPINFYGRSKLAGEEAVRAATSNHVILRTSWIYAPEGQNFLRTMLRLAGDRDEIRVVADQHGTPTSARDLAAAIEQIARNLVASPNEASLRGLFHLTNSGVTTWAGFAAEIFAMSAALGGPHARVIPIATSDFPTPARRPTRSQLDIAKIAHSHGIKPREWRQALQTVMEQVTKNSDM